MVGVSTSIKEFPFTRFTDLSMALLMDTGFYKVDYKRGKPMWWGSKETNGGKYAKEFCTGAPQLVFPPGHIAPADRSPELKTAGFDHSYLGYATAFDVTLPDVVKANADYYNPNRSIYYGHPIAEYQRIILPGSECPNNTAAVNLKAADAECLAYNCSDGEVVFSSPSIGEVKCRSLGEEAKGSNNKTVECPDPKSFCMRVGLRYEALDKSPFEGVGGGGIEWWVIAIIVIVVVVAVIAAVCITLYCFCKKDEQPQVIEPIL